MVERMGPQIAHPEVRATFDQFADSRCIFIHGLLGSERVGTCSSMPVLYAAVARRLGYPVKVATNTGHVFNRWEDDRESFNMEGTGTDYINNHPDSHYIDDVRRWTDYERYNDYLLRGRTSVEELSLFCDIRAACLFKNGRFDEALACWTRVWQLMPENEGAGANIRFALNQKLPEYVRRDVLPPSPHFNYQHPDNFIIAIAPVATQAALFAARGIFHAFHERLDQAREAFQTACRIAPDNPEYPQMLASAEARQYHRLPPSKSVLAAIKIAEEAEELIRLEKRPEAIARLARAYRLHPRNPAYWCRIADIVTIKRGGVYSGPFYRPEQISTLLTSSGDNFLHRGDLMEARYALEEALHLTPGDTHLRTSMFQVTKRSHEANLAAKQSTSQKVQI